MANNNEKPNIQELCQIRVRGTVSLSHLIQPENFKGKDSYEVALTNMQFEDPNSYPDPQKAQLAIEQTKARIKPAKDGYEPTLWLRLPVLSNSGKQNDVAYLDNKTKKRFPKKQEINRGTVVTAVVNSFVMPDSGLLKPYQGVAIRLIGIIFDDKDNPNNWYTPGNSIDGFDMSLDDASVDDASANTASQPANDSTPAWASQNAPADNPNPGANTQSAPANASNAANNTQNPSAPFGGNNGQNPSAPFGGNAGQNQSAPFGTNNGQNASAPFGGNAGQNPSAPFGTNNGQNPSAPFGGNAQNPSAPFGGNAGQNPSAPFGNNQ